MEDRFSHDSWHAEDLQTVRVFVSGQVSDERPVNRGRLFQYGSKAMSPIGEKLIFGIAVKVRGYASNVMVQINLREIHDSLCNFPKSDQSRHVKVKDPSLAGHVLRRQVVQSLGETPF